MNNVKLTTVLWTMLLTFIGIIITILIINFSKSKINNGYYLNQGFHNSQLAIWIDWDNRIDEKVFQHPDINIVLQVYSQLNAQLNGQIVKSNQNDE